MHLVNENNMKRCNDAKMTIESFREMSICLILVVQSPIPIGNSIGNGIRDFTTKIRQINVSLNASMKHLKYCCVCIDDKRIWPFFLLHRCIFYIHDANGRRSILSKVFINIVQDWKTLIISLAKLRNIARNKLNLLFCHLLIY